MKARIYVAALAWIALSKVAAAGGIPIHEDSVVVLATVESGRHILSTSDRYTQRLSRFDLESRLSTNGDVSEADLLQFAAEQVLPWTDEDRKKLDSIVRGVRQQLGKYQLPFPETILLIKTTGDEEGDAAYCRQNAIVLPRRRVAADAAALERLLIHELFHILSSHNRELRHALYKVIGFRPGPEIELPPEYAERKITNPDGPSLRYYIELNIDRQNRRTVPFLFAKSRFDPERGESLFRYLQFRLLAVEQIGDWWRPVETDGKLVMLDPKQTPAYRRKIGNNTNYTIHPDEILAENFVHLVQKKQNLPNPEIIEAIRELIKE